jgi:hypothetical protein
VQSVLSLEVLEDGGEGGAEKRVTAPTSVFIRCTPQFERTKQIWCLRASNGIGCWTLWTVPVLGLSRQPMVLLGLEEGGKEWNGAFQTPVGRGRHPSWDAPPPPPKHSRSGRAAYTLIVFARTLFRRVKPTSSTTEPTTTGTSEDRTCVGRRRNRLSLRDRRPRRSGGDPWTCHK